MRTIWFSHEACLGVKWELPARMLLEPVVHVVGVVIGEVVTDEVAAAAAVALVHDVEQVDECVAAASFRGEAEELAAAHVVGAHEAQRAMADVLELAANGLAGAHGDVGVFALKRLHPRLLVDADDVLVDRRVVVDA